MKYIEGMMVNDEIDLVLARIKYLYDVVDHFILVEADLTHSNKKKPYHFKENFDMFSEVKDKVILHNISIEGHPSTESWFRENAQRNHIKNLIQNFDDDDIFFISDADEIQDKSKVSNVIDCIKEHEFCKIQQEMFYYNLSNKLVSYPIWGAAFAATKRFIQKSDLTLSKLRMISSNEAVYTGWHLTYFMTPEKIKNKIQSFAHTELDKEKYTNLSKIEHRMKNNIDPYDREDGIFAQVNPETHYPEHFLEYFGKWK